jgi:hypothetical protein
LEIWDVSKGKKIAQAKFDSPVTYVGFLRKRNLLLVSAGDVSLCDPANGRIVRRLANDFSPDVIAISRDEKFVAFPVRREDRIEIRTLDNWKLQRKIKVKSPTARFIRTMDYSTNGRLLETGVSDVPWDGIGVYDMESARKIWTVTDESQQGNVAWSHDGKHIGVNVTTGVLLLRARDGHLIKKFSFKNYPTYYGSHVRFVSNGRRLVFANNNLL